MYGVGNMEVWPSFLPITKIALGPSCDVKIPTTLKYLASVKLMLTPLILSILHFKNNEAKRNSLLKMWISCCGNINNIRNHGRWWMKYFIFFPFRNIFINSLHFFSITYYNVVDQSSPWCNWGKVLKKM